MLKLNEIGPVVTSVLVKTGTPDTKTSDWYPVHLVENC